MSIKPLLPLIDALHQRILTIPQALEQRHQTSAITEELYRWCEREHSALSTEAKIGRIAYKSSGKMRNARVDAFVRTEMGALYAIEVDRTNKTWSVDKLLHCFSQYEAIPVWIRWRGEIVGHLPESIYVVDISPEGYSKWLSAIRKDVEAARETPKKKIYSVAAIRDKYPHAYQKWEDNDEICLRRLYSQGVKNAQIARTLGRQPSATRIRIKRLLSKEGLKVLPKDSNT
jgi:hypothetical protein